MSTGKSFDKAKFTQWANGFYDKNSEYLINAEGKVFSKEQFLYEVFNQVLMRGQGHSKTSTISMKERENFIEAAWNNTENYSNHVPQKLRDMDPINQTINMSTPSRKPNTTMDLSFVNAREVYREVQGIRNAKDSSFALKTAEEQLAKDWIEHAQGGVQSSMQKVYLSALRVFWLKHPESKLSEGEYEMLSDLHNLVTNKDEFVQIFSDVLPSALATPNKFFF
jgi:hypothetical protein